MPSCWPGDLDTATLIRYIDRFLMYYIRTADRLQRTAPWVRTWTAGWITYARCVRRLAGSGRRIRGRDRAARRQNYACEWKGVLEDPDKLSRFVSFVNAPDVADSTVTFTERAGRKVPVSLDSGDAAHQGGDL